MPYARGGHSTGAHGLISLIELGLYSSCFVCPVLFCHRDNGLTYFVSTPSPVHSVHVFTKRHPSWVYILVLHNAIKLCRKP